VINQSEIRNPNTEAKPSKKDKKNASISQKSSISKSIIGYFHKSDSG